MSKTTQHLLLVLILLCLAGCSSVPAISSTAEEIDPDLNDAQQILVDFFRLLHEGRYGEAVDYYAGSYEWLIAANPDLPASDYPALLERGCRQNGLMCLEVLRVEPTTSASQNLISFQVEFQLDDGSLFILGPCCGADETEMPPISLFQYQMVQGENGSWKAVDLPPFVP